MKVLSPTVHGYLDYLIVAAFLLAPSLFNFSSFAASVSYVIAITHFLLTIFTRFPLGIFKLVPFTTHGTLELFVSIGLVALPFILGFVEDTAARNFYIAFGIVIFGVRLITDYKAADIQNSSFSHSNS